MREEMNPLVRNRPEKLCKVRGVEGVLETAGGVAAVPNHFSSIYEPSFPSVMFKMAVEILCSRGKPRGNTWKRT
jgi:hypothetical protein